MINELARVGVDGGAPGQRAKVHVSGHASAGELLYLLQRGPAEATSSRCTANGGTCGRNAALAIATGVPEDRVVLAEDGIVVDLVDGKARSSGTSRSAWSTSTAIAVGDVGEDTLSDRLILGEGGFISITVAIDSHTGRAVASPTISGRGFSDDPKALDAVLPLVEAELARMEADGITDPHRIAQAVRRVVGRWVGDTYRRR